MKRAVLAAVLGIALLGLVGCGPSECEQAGGALEIDYYLPMTTVISTGKSVVPVTTMTPVYKCVISEEQR